MNDTLITVAIKKQFSEFTLECEAAFGAEVTAIFGPSGSGKTTLLNCIAGLVNPDEGEIVFSGSTLFSSKNKKHVPPEKRRFGYVFQDSALFPHMSVHENILYGYRLTPSQYRKTDPEFLIELLQLSPLLKRSVIHLSGGERQRVALARALAASPDLLLLDEPLASLDGGFRGVIIEHLKQIRRELNTPMIYVSHSISEVMALADHALVLVDGKIVANGRASQILVNPRVHSIADYAAFENLLEAEVILINSDEGLAEIQVGNERIIAPDVFRQPGERVIASVRAGDIIISRDIPPQISARNILKARIEEIHHVGSRVLVYTDIGTRLIAEITPGSLRTMNLEEGQDIYLIIKTNSVMVLDTASQSLR